MKIQIKTPSASKYRSVAIGHRTQITIDGELWRDVSKVEFCIPADDKIQLTVEYGTRDADGKIQLTEDGKHRVQNTKTFNLVASADLEFEVVESEDADRRSA